MTPSRGRPQDRALTATLLDCTLDLLADGGLTTVNADAVAARAHSGKAAVYRRWSSIPELVAGAVHTCDLVHPVPDTGALRPELVALLAPWTRPLSRCERAAAALLGHTGRDSELNRALDERLVQPLAGTVAQIAGRHVQRGNPTAPARTRLLQKVVQSLWWQRYAGHSDPSSAADVAELVDLVLVPVLASD